MTPAAQDLMRSIFRSQLRMVRQCMPAERTGLLGPYVKPAPAWRMGALYVLTSVQPVADGTTWYHVSYSRQDQIPTHEDTCAVRKAFFRADALAVAVFPPVDEYVNIHPRTLHLWQRLLPEDRLIPDLRGVHPLTGEAMI